MNQLNQLVDQQAQESQDLEEKLKKSEQKENEKLSNELERERDEILGELKSKQQAEIEARQGQADQSQMHLLLKVLTVTSFCKANLFKNPGLSSIEMISDYVSVRELQSL